MNTSRIDRGFWISTVVLVASSRAVLGLDLSDAIVVHAAGLSRPEQKAVAMLVDEVEKRAHLTWRVSTNWPLDGRPVIALGQRSAWKLFSGQYAQKAVSELKPEGFHIETDTAGASPAVLIAGSDPRGVLYAVGQLLRTLQIQPGKVDLDEDFRITTSPRYRLRGHQLGYRPKTHSYDAWDLAMWEQYYRDLVVFGANAIELIPPRSDDDADSPHFPLPPLEMMRGMSRLADDYDLDVWVWYPAMDRDYSDPGTVEAAVREWRKIFEALPRLDAVFVPGGDPGHTRPRVLLKLLEEEARSLREVHPAAEMWVSPQSFDREWLNEFLDILRNERPGWLSGVVFGPQVRMSLRELRKAVPERYPIRHYPDITHTRQCQYPVPDWDVAFAVTEGRECVNPRPMDEAAIFHRLQPDTIGFLTYSEGCNDDVNKAIWSALGWDPDRPVEAILREYSRYFVGGNLEEGFAQGLLALERNWRGPVAANPNIETTLRQFEAMERGATPAQRGNWRFQEALYRAYYDAYVRRRRLAETCQEAQALDELAGANRTGAIGAMRRAEAILDRAVTECAAPELRARIFELAEALFQSVRMQLSVERYQAIAVDRGANLDTVDFPLNNRLWLLQQFEKIRSLKSERERVAALDEIVNWTNPGPGGFYDDLGNPSCQPHLVRGAPFAEDPASLISSKTGFEEGTVVDEPDEAPSGALRLSWMDHAESLNDQALQVRYDRLDPGSRYRVRIIYGGDSPKRRIRLTAGDGIVIHDFRSKGDPYEPVEFAIPKAAIRGGSLTLAWNRESGLGGNGRGCQVAEIWLIRESK